MKLIFNALFFLSSLLSLASLLGLYNPPESFSELNISNKTLIIVFIASIVASVVFYFSGKAARSGEGKKSQLQIFGRGNNQNMDS